MGPFVSRQEDWVLEDAGHREARGEDVEASFAC